MNELIAFDCYWVKFDEIHQTIYATTSGQAKMRLYEKIKDPYPDVKFTDLRAVKIKSYIAMKSEAERK